MKPSQLFKDKVFLTKKILKHRIPNELFKEIKTMVDLAEKKKNSKYYFLLEHENNGKNSYQISVDNNFFEQSFIYGYLIKLGECYSGFKIRERNIRIRRNHDHYDHYDLWVNFAEKDSENTPHSHSGYLSGVIYYTDCFNAPTIFDDLAYYGKPRDVLIFPSGLEHEVKKYPGPKTRISLAFNLYSTSQ